MTRGPPARLFDGCRRARSDSFGDASPELWRQGSNLHGAAGRNRRTARRPVEGGVERRDVQNEESSELLFRIGKRSILYVPPFIIESHRGCRVRPLEWIA